MKWEMDAVDAHGTTAILHCLIICHIEQQDGLHAIHNLDGLD